jgi:AraC family transcriptional regulator of adaptative response/methylated-DNA-[protein]-cysteine methyltransferase
MEAALKRKKRSARKAAARYPLRMNNSRHAQAVADACRAIESAEEAPALGALAKAAGMSPFHFQRVFTSVAGMSPKAYALGRRERKVREDLPKARSVTEAIYGAGFGSNSRFYERAAGALGMKPSSFSAGGQDATIRFAVGQSSVGAILVAATDKGVCAVYLGDTPEPLVRELQKRFSKAALIGADPKFERLVARVVGLVEAPQTGSDLPLDVRGTAFQQRVWRALRAIPAGKTASYADIAKKIGAPKSFRAVARACATNEVSVLIPCHRVVRTDGGLSGYRWGIARKRALLDREKP